MPVDYFPQYHAMMLRRAAPSGFSKTALMFRIIPANIAVDLNQKDKWLHFDDSTFQAGVEHVEGLWARIEMGEDWLTSFGKLTHTVQDFYSHSNWVELHKDRSPVPAWDLTIGSLPAQIVSGTYPGRAERQARPHRRTLS